MDVLPFYQFLDGCFKAELYCELAPETVFRVWCLSASVWNRGCRRQCFRVGKTFGVGGRHATASAFTLSSIKMGCNSEERFVLGVLYRHYSVMQAGGNVFPRSHTAGVAPGVDVRALVIHFLCAASGTTRSHDTFVKNR